MVLENRLTYCRICSGRCGLQLTVETETNTIRSVRPDKQHPMTRGYACIKGLQADSLHQHKTRLLHSLERQPDGHFKKIPTEVALDRIAARLSAIRQSYGADAIATFRGTQHYNNSTAFHMLSAFTKALGTRSRFSTMTIDQSAKWVTDLRLGTWAAGRHRFEQSDVWMFVGYNPLVSVLGNNGTPALDPTRSIKAARARGMKIIVVDPRRTETAHFADLHLPVKPGEDPTLFAGLLNVIFEQNWYDSKFCECHVDGLEPLKAALRPFTLGYVSARTGVDASLLYDAAKLFAYTGTRGIAVSGTGPNMIPRSNLAEHLIELLNVVCGRFPRAGEPVANPGVFSAPRRTYADVVAPTRSWETSLRSRVRNLGMMMGEKMAGVLAEEILTPGDGQIRALIVDGGNPVNALPDRSLAVKAMSDLDLLVCIDPFLSETAQMADYVLPATMMFERPDIPLLFEKTANPVPFAQYTDAIVAPPNQEVVEDWYVFWALARRMGLTLNFSGRSLSTQVRPTTEFLLECLASEAKVPLNIIKSHPRGAIFDVPVEFVQPSRDARAANRFQVAPDEVLRELAEVHEENINHNEYRLGKRYPLRLISRRAREVMNTGYRQMDFVRQRMPQNPLWMHPSDMQLRGLQSGQTVDLTSAHGTLCVEVHSDATMREGVVSICHGWGGSGGSLDHTQEIGVNINDIIPLGDFVEAINGMPWFSAVPVEVALSGTNGS